jgi:predicted NAD/FAD-dependent oxidoreductase
MQAAPGWSRPCGDWLIGPRVESAWLSGVRLAELIGAQL